ncbi:hypothetical protein K505DRAFT_116919 [Melanomma pulvis-pyrius CBS 109.77]|uniref:Uncharacterized protein n=1 Tax=Melanomma pulvis-pyrius CBS 109.77 TaxID=1314802 RepID=A0A6A6WWH7_9PLEO|nr:hypothetical protein K505DRAFT_116919 [Melanomma pulvis-pyrius CBS 109.77]
MHLEGAGSHVVSFIFGGPSSASVTSKHPSIPSFHNLVLERTRFGGMHPPALLPGVATYIQRSRVEYSMTATGPDSKPRQTRRTIGPPQKSNAEVPSTQHARQWLRLAYADAASTCPGEHVFWNLAFRYSFLLPNAVVRLCMGFVFPRCRDELERCDTHHWCWLCFFPFRICCLRCRAAPRAGNSFPWSASGM